MPFPLGAEVLVAGLDKPGTVEEVAANGRYRVAIGALKLWCNEARLSSATVARKPARRRKDARGAAGAQEAHALVSTGTTEGERRALATLDLHGMTVEEAVFAVEVRLDLAIRNGLERLEIIHGIGGGRLRHAVRAFLNRIGSVKRVEHDPRNPGVTIVWM